MLDEFHIAEKFFADGKIGVVIPILYRRARVCLLPGWPTSEIENLW